MVQKKNKVGVIIRGVRVGWMDDGVGGWCISSIDDIEDVHDSVCSKCHLAKVRVVCVFVVSCPLPFIWWCGWGIRLYQRWQCMVHTISVI